MPSLMPIRESSKGQKAIWKPSHQACDDEPSKPKYVYVNRSTALPTAWKGSENWVEFAIPKEMGLLSATTIVFDVANAQPEPVTALPTPFWCARIETYLGTDILETVYADDQYHEAVGFRTAQSVDQLNEVLNITTDYTLQDNGIPAGNSRYYLPLDGSVLTAMRPFVRGFDAQFKIRLYFASKIQVGAGSDLSLSDVSLICEEAQLSATELVRTASAHARAVVDYSVVIRERQQESVTFSNDKDVKPIYLRSFKNDSAGILVYSTKQQPLLTERLDRSELSELTLQDAMGNKITEVLRGPFLKAFTWSDHVDSPFVTHGVKNNLYLVPFSSSFQDTVIRGCDFGKFAMSTQEKLMVVPSGAYNDQLVTVVSYSHGHIVCAGGKHYITMTSTAERRN